MASVNIDVDLDEFDTDELIDELNYRIKCNKRDAGLVKDWINEIDLDVKKPLSLSVLDEMKIDFLINNLHRISINDLENLLK